MYYVYVLYDKYSKRFYTGYTHDLYTRLKQHQWSNVQTTKKMSQPILIYYEACLNKTDARKRENQLKTGFGRSYLKRRLYYFLASF